MKHQHVMEKVYDSMEHEYNVNHHKRTYIGMSGFDSGCDRKQWMNFRHVYEPYINYTSGSFFADGHASEAILIERLVSAGYYVKSEEDNGGQIAVQHGYWTRGHLDLIITVDGVEYVADVKSTDDEKKNKIKKLIEKDESIALKKYSPNYYAQNIWYQGMTGIHNGMLFFTGHGARERINSKGDNRTVVVDVPWNAEKFEELKAKADNIIATDKLPEPAPSLQYDKPLCIWGDESHQRCEAYDYCKFGIIGDPDCFNCAYVSFHDEGATCILHGKEMNEKNMSSFYECHKYNPTLIHQYELICRKEDGTVLYRKPNGDEIIKDNSVEFMNELNETARSGEQYRKWKRNDK